MERQGDSETERGTEHRNRMTETEKPRATEVAAERETEIGTE